MSTPTEESAREAHGSAHAQNEDAHASAHEHEHEALPEGDESPPPFVRVMAVARWGLILALAVLATLSVARSFGLFDTAVADTASYHCPMHPEIVSDHPGECPICGMALVVIDRADSPQPAAPDALYVCPMHPEVVSHDAHARCPKCGMALQLAPPPEPPTGITMSAADRARFGVTLAPVERRALAPRLEAVGVLEADEARIARVHARSAGYIETLAVAETYARVKAGAALFGLYSPDLFAAQQELVSAARAGDPAEGLRRAAHNKLARFGMDEADIAVLEHTLTPTRVITMRAPLSGIVTQKAVVRGSYVEEGSLLFELTDLSQLWLVAELAEDEAQELRVGMTAEVAVAGEQTPRTAKIDAIYPELNAARRSVRIRIRLPNPSLTLRPGLSARLTVLSKAVERLTVPESAVVRLGEGPFVFVENGTRLERRAVLLGPQADGLVSIREGLSETDHVVTAASFLVDSETRLDQVGRALGAHPPHAEHTEHAGEAKPTLPGSAP